jgi:hypothetical protein
MEQTETMVEKELSNKRLEQTENFLGKYRNIIFTIFVIVAIIFFVYSFLNIHAIVIDPCDICVNKTGATCTRIDYTFLNR